MSAANFPRRFGKYILLDHLATGGMAEVYIAKVSGVESFERLLAIKCMRPELAADQEFATMFVDEANVAGRLNHTNVVQIYELGRFEGQLYIAMELVEGLDLRSILEKARERGERLSVPFCAYVINRAARGLDYAHKVVNSKGEPLNLVHRDISPPNLLVSYEGEVKVVDFGIAKANSRAQETRVGVLKGKFSYMAPEQAAGDPIDRRTDIFTLGVVLYELLTGRKLFGGDNEFEILERVRKAEVGDLAAELEDAPPELVSVLLNSLALKPSQRFEYAGEMAKALEPLLINDRSIFGPGDAAQVLESLFRDEITRQRSATAQLANIPMPEGDENADSAWSSTTETFHSHFELTPSPEALRAAMTPVQRDPGFWTQPTVSIRKREIVEALADTNTSSRPVSQPQKPVGLWIGLGVGLALAATLALIFWPSKPNAPPARENKAEVQRSPSRESDARAERDERTESASSERDFGYLTVKVRGSKGAVVFVDGKPAGRAPVESLRVPTGTRVIKVEGKQRSKKRTQVKRVTVSAKNTRRSPVTVVFAL